MQPSFVVPPVSGAGRSVTALSGDALRRPGGRRVLSVLSVVLFVAGIAMFAYPVFTDLYSTYEQDHLTTQFGGTTLQQQYRTHQVPVGSALTRLRIPEIKLDVVVVEGTTPAALRAGAGHYVGTPLPGEAGNVGIAGHRTTFGRPFNHIDELHPGSLAVLETPFARYTYRAVNPFGGHANPWIVAPTDYSVVGQEAGRHSLTLTSCHPKGSARQRIILRLELVKTDALTPTTSAP